MYVAILENTVDHEKQLIDDLIHQIADRRIKYMLRTFNPYQRLIKFLDNGETKDAVLKHRFYVEYKIKEVILNV